MMLEKQKRLIISALSGGSGKTLCALGLCRALHNAGHTVLPFKKGPDYIDTAWLSLASKMPAYNLDPFFLNAAQLQDHFLNICARKDESIAIIEGNRGLFDGKNYEGTASTAELAHVLQTPVVLTIDTKKSTRTLAAIINGITGFDKRISIIGLILNNVASARHEKVIFDSINYYCDTPIYGFLPRFKENPLPERHLGLEFNAEQSSNEKILNSIASTFAEHIDIQKIIADISLCADIPFSHNNAINEKHEEINVHTEKVRIGYIFDKAIWFYYNENLEALRNENAELIPLSLFETYSEEFWNSLDALYVGGGYPEIYASEIEQSQVLTKIKYFSEMHMPIYAECGGLMLLTRSVSDGGDRYAMANIFPLDVDFHKKPQGLGYVEAKVIEDNPYFSVGTTINAHEFHYSCASNPPQTSIFSLQSGVGMGNAKDGVLYNNVFAAYTHIYALENEEWAKNFVKSAREYRCEKNEK